MARTDDDTWDLADSVERPRPASWWDERCPAVDIEMTDLWYAGDRNDVVDYLDAHGWTTSASGVPELAGAYGLSLSPRPTDKEETLSAMHYVIAERT
jgi:O-methyltransferase involved in polyketide biosynthesis